MRCRRGIHHHGRWVCGCRCEGVIMQLVSGEVVRVKIEYM